MQKTAHSSAKSECARRAQRCVREITFPMSVLAREYERNVRTYERRKAGSRGRIFRGRDKSSPPSDDCIRAGTSSGNAFLTTPAVRAGAHNNRLRNLIPRRAGFDLRANYARRAPGIFSPLFSSRPTCCSSPRTRVILRNVFRGSGSSPPAVRFFNLHERKVETGMHSQRKRERERNGDRER